jgi:hypothetical protein
MGTGNGVSLCCRNHVIRLASDPGVELFGFVIGPEARRAGTAAFFAELGVSHHFETYHEHLPTPRPRDFGRSRISRSRWSSNIPGKCAR